MNTKEPRLIIGGASKSGTTAIYYYLKQHPGFCLPEKKELHFFSRPFLEKTVSGPGDRYVLAEIPGTFDDYLSFFSHCGNGKVAVEVSPSYLYHYQTADLIKQRFAEPRVVFLLRDPADKAFSQYLHLVGAGREMLDFETALAKEQERKEQGFSDMWLYRTSGYYAAALDHYMARIGRTNVKVFYYEEFQRNPERVLGEICVFAGVREPFRFEPVREVNRSGRPASAWVAKLIGPNPITYLVRRVAPRNLGRAVRKIVKDWNTGAKPELDHSTRRALLEGYRDDIIRVEALVGRKSGWLS
jgi:hypothetical protein